VESVWEKRKAVGRRHRGRYESLGFEIEVSQEEPVRWGRRAFFIRR
jgi:hypothetical protein